MKKPVCFWPGVTMPATLSPTSDRSPASSPSPVTLWTPRAIAFIPFFPGFPGGLAPAVLSWRRMGLKEQMERDMAAFSAGGGQVWHARRAGRCPIALVAPGRFLLLALLMALLLPFLGVPIPA